MIQSSQTPPMPSKRVLNCPNCSAPLPADGHCEYCGTVYRDGLDNIRCEIRKPDHMAVYLEVLENISRKC